MPNSCSLTFCIKTGFFFKASSYVKQTSSNLLLPIKWRSQFYPAQNAVWSQIVAVYTSVGSTNLCSELITLGSQPVSGVIHLLHLLQLRALGIRNKSLGKPSTWVLPPLPICNINGYLDFSALELSTKGGKGHTEVFLDTSFSPTLPAWMLAKTTENQVMKATKSH